MAVLGPLGGSCPWLGRAWGRGSALEISGAQGGKGRGSCQRQADIPGSLETT